MLGSLYVAGVCLAMFVSVQMLLIYDAFSEFGLVGKLLSKTTCYACSIVFLVGFVVEIERLVAA